MVGGLSRSDHCARRLGNSVKVPEGMKRAGHGLPACGGNLYGEPFVHVGAFI
jgi:hypothetical protein